MSLMLVALTLFVALMAADADAETAAERLAVTQQKTEPAEITIYIRGGHKAVAAALLDAVDEGTPVTGIADFDSLSATYGLIGIYRKGRRYSGFYGYRFRLTFPPDADVAAIDGAFWNLPYVQSVEPSSEARARKLVHMGSGKRVATKLASGALAGLGIGSVMGLGVSLAISSTCEDSGYDNNEGPFCGYYSSCCGFKSAVYGILAGLISYPAGTAVGVSRVDPHDRFIASLGGSVVGLLGGIWLTAASKGTLWPSLFVGPVAMATAWSERSRKPPESRRVSFGLSPTLNGGLSAVATLRF